MAKKENATEITGGLTTGGLLDGLTFGASRTARETPVEKEVQPQPKTESKTTLKIGDYGFKTKAPERKNVRLNLLIKGSLADKLEEATEEGKIKSRNDLVNILLMRHCELIEAIENGQIKTREEMLDFLAKQYFGE